jgi:hypothetical protein
MHARHASMCGGRASASEWNQGNAEGVPQIEQANLEQQRRVARKMKSLGRTPLPMVLARVHQIVASVAALRADAAVVQAALRRALMGPAPGVRASFRAPPGAAHATLECSRRPCPNAPCRAGRARTLAPSRNGREVPELAPAHSLTAPASAGPPSGLMLSLEPAAGDGAPPPPTITGRRREEAQLRMLETKERALSEELAVRARRTRMHYMHAPPQWPRLHERPRMHAGDTAVPQRATAHAATADAAAAGAVPWAAAA